MFHWSCDCLWFELHESLIFPEVEKQSVNCCVNEWYAGSVAGWSPVDYSCYLSNPVNRSGFTVPPKWNPNQGEWCSGKLQCLSDGPRVLLVINNGSYRSALQPVGVRFMCTCLLGLVCVCVSVHSAHVDINTQIRPNKGPDFSRGMKARAKQTSAYWLGQWALHIKGSLQGCACKLMFSQWKEVENSLFIT